jgi:hypothetical protein
MPRYDSGTTAKVQRAAPGWPKKLPKALNDDASRGAAARAVASSG